MRTALLVLVVVIVIVFDGFAIERALNETDAERRQVALELAKLATQALLVGFAAGVLVQEYGRRRERKTAVNSFRKSIYTSLVHVYSNTKRSRRILRARCQSLSADRPAENAERGVPRDVYEAQMLYINDTQLEIEIMRHEIRGISKAFSDRETLLAHLKTMDGYLDELIDEFKDDYSRISASVTCLPLQNLPKLSDFLLSGKTERGNESKFRTEFGHSFREALTLIQQERLKA